MEKYTHLKGQCKLPLKLMPPITETHTSLLDKKDQREKNIYYYLCTGKYVNFNFLKEKGSDA